MATQVDFWGEIGRAEPVRTPVAILREQAALLGSKTQNVVEVKVSPLALKGGFVLQFNIVVPGLDHYPYELFEIVTGVSPYAVTGAGKELTTEEEFTDWLNAKLSSPETKRTISNLLAQAIT